MSRFVHYAHGSKLLVKLGDYVKRGQPILRVGNTGASTGAHCHIEGTMWKPKNWREYVRGMSLAAVKAKYFDVTKFYNAKASIPLQASFPNVGYKFLQFVREATTRPYGGYWHPGDDANGQADFGKPINSLFNGRIVFIEDVVGGSDYNGGWGKHVWMEINEADPGIK